LPEVYDELRSLARSFLRGEDPPVFYGLKNGSLYVS